MFSSTSGLGVELRLSSEIAVEGGEEYTAVDVGGSSSRSWKEIGSASRVIRGSWASILEDWAVAKDD